MVSDNHTITLRDISRDNVSAICALSVSEEQKAYVASTAKAIAEACYSNDEWIQAIYADEVPVGLVVMKINADQKQHFLWRFMIDKQYQGQGIGRRAIDLLVEYIKTQPNNGEFLTSVVAGDYTPQTFYENLGFQLTGEHYEDEALLKLSIG